MGISSNYLLVSPFFPPLGGSGVQRSAKLAKYTARLGWEPHVLVMKSAPSFSYPKDPALFGEIKHLNLYPTRRIDLRMPSRLLHTLGAHELAARLLWLLPMDGYLGWVPFAIRQAEKLLATRKIKLVYTTSDPWSTTLVGWWLKKHHGIPWVADFRDPWTTSPTIRIYRDTSLLARWRTWLDRGLEDQVLNAADRICVVIEQHKNDLVATFGIAPDKVRIIHNGYDEEDFDRLPFPFVPHQKLFRISYLGSFQFWGNVVSYTPEPFFDMFQRFIDTCRDPGSVRLRFVGSSSKWIKNNPDVTAPFAKYLELYDYVPHDEIPNHLQESTVLLLANPDRLSLSGKLFEYLRSGLPILCVTPSMDSELIRILRKAGTGFVVQREDIAGGAQMLSALFGYWAKNHWPLKCNDELVKKFSRETQALKFIALFEELSTLK